MEKPSMLGIIARTLIELVVTIAVLTIVLTTQHPAYWPTVTTLGVLSVGVVIIRAWRGHRPQGKQSEERASKG